MAARIFKLTDRHEVAVPTVGTIFEGELTLDPKGLATLARASLARLEVGADEHFGVIVSGFTPAVLAVLVAAEGRCRAIDFMHFDRETGQYVNQTVFTACLHG